VVEHGQHADGRRDGRQRRDHPGGQGVGVHRAAEDAVAVDLLPEEKHGAVVDQAGDEAARPLPDDLGEPKGLGHELRRERLLLRLLQPRTGLHVARSRGPSAPARLFVRARLHLLVLLKLRARLLAAGRFREAAGALPRRRRCAGRGAAGVPGRLLRPLPLQAFLADGPLGVLVGDAAVDLDAAAILEEIEVEVQEVGLRGGERGGGGERPLEAAAAAEEERDPDQRLRVLPGGEARAGVGGVGGRPSAPDRRRRGIQLRLDPLERAADPLHGRRDLGQQGRVELLLDEGLFPPGGPDREKAQDDARSHDQSGQQEARPPKGPAVSRSPDPALHVPPPSRRSPVPETPPARLLKTPPAEDSRSRGRRKRTAQYSARLFSVAGPAIPSASRPWFRWYSDTARATSAS